MKGSLWWAFMIVLLLAASLAGRGALVMVALMLALTTLVSSTWGRHTLTNVSYRRQLGKANLRYGEETSLVIEIVNSKFLPLAWLRALDAFPLKLTVSTAPLQHTQMHDSGLLVTLLSLRWFERVRHIHRITGSHRGRFLIGPVELSSADIFGFNRSYRTDPVYDVVTVYPRIVPIRELVYPAGRPVGEVLGQRRIIEDPLRFSAVREYRTGDNPRHIHWRASARTGQLQVKIFDPSETIALMLAVDVQTSDEAYAYVADWLELVLSAAASVAVDSLERRHMVGLYLNSIGPRGERWLTVSPGRHERQAADLLGTLAAAEPFRGSPFVEMVRSMRINLPYGTTVVAITASPSDELYEALGLLQEAGHPVSLLTVGDMPPVVPERIESHHLGGSDAWQRLQAL
ncbi:MAG: DUF58 domain-containing protein [Anaerolineae bacterium]|nr:DUF58 domain-containing protein [Chloroflexota bacterium]